MKSLVVVLALSLPAVAGAASAPSVTRVLVPGVASDAFAAGHAGGRGVFVTTAGPTYRGVLRLEREAAIRVEPAPSGAVFVGVCPALRVLVPDRLVYATSAGLVDATGTVVLGGESLFVVPDPDTLYVADLCAPAGTDRVELRVPTERGLAVKQSAAPGAPEAPGAATTRQLRFPHRGRTYSGRVHRGLQPARPYAAAASVYAPLLVDADVDGDRDQDLVAVHEDRLLVFVRGEDGLLVEEPAVVQDLRTATGGGAGDLRVHVGDLDDDGRADFVVGRANGILAERSSAFWVRSGGALFDTVSTLWDEAGLVAPLALIDRPSGSSRDPHSGPAILTTRLDTSMVALGAALVSGKLDAPLTLRRPVAAPGAPTARTRRGRPGPPRPLTTIAIAPGPTVEAVLDVRLMQMGGALPVTGVDLDQDGLSDLLDVGTPGEAALYRGTPQGFETEPSLKLAVPRFVHLVALPSEHSVVLIGSPTRGGKPTTMVAVIAARR